MSEAKDLKLVNIYIKIHNKKVLTFDDLAYLARFNPECFKKTCDNLLYKIPDAKSLAESASEQTAHDRIPAVAAAHESNVIELTADERLQIENLIIQFFDGMKGLESGEIDTLQNIDASHVRELMGDLLVDDPAPRKGRDMYFDFAAVKAVDAFSVMA